MPKFYKRIYVVAFQYFQKIWGEKSTMVPFNATLALSLSLICFIMSLMLICFLLFDSQVVFMFSNKFLVLLILGIIIAWHYLKFEYKSRFVNTIKWHENQNFSRKNQLIVQSLVFLYLFGSILLFVTLAIISTNKVIAG